MSLCNIGCVCDRQTQHFFVLTRITLVPLFKRLEPKRSRLKNELGEKLGC
ncbi:hypothetical protein [Nostoc sp. CHAB 5715]|nr:hypothetical protein [Nostoc sp. CHAB 5715]MCC5620346.1 hypothetical protein [Nostoc sp. CHAB 5715]